MLHLHIIAFTHLKSSYTEHVETPGTTTKYNLHYRQLLP